jgi:hypothetical protein
MRKAMELGDAVFSEHRYCSRRKSEINGRSFKEAVIAVEKHTARLDNNINAVASSPLTSFINFWHADSADLQMSFVLKH